MDCRLIFRRFVLSLCVIILFFSAALKGNAQLDNFELITSNEYLNLYIDPDTTEVAVEDRNTSKIWYTNPQERHSERGLNFERLSSQFTIIHDPNEVEKENYRFSTMYDQFEICPIENGFRVDYTIVEKWNPEHYAPRMIQQSRMDQMIISGIDDESYKQDVLDIYHLIMLAPLNGGERPHILGLDQERIFGDYEVVILNKDYQEREAQLFEMKLELEKLHQESTDRADLESSISQLERQLAKEKEEIIWRLIYTIVDYRLDVDKTNDVSHEHVAHLINTPTYLMDQVARFVLSNVQELIVESGYTPLECAEDHDMNRLDPLLPNLQTFSVPIEYSLDGPNLLVRIPAKDIVYPVDVEDSIGEKYSYPLLKIRLMEYFGAADNESTGYIFVPDGSGALIYLNNGRLSASAYNEPVYGIDNALETLEEKRRYPETIRLPVFGLKQGDQAIFAIIEEGASLARIKADISGRINNYNRVFAEFSFIASGTISISLDSDDVEFSGSMPTYQARNYEGDYVIRYSFLSGDDAGYVGMAKLYQDYLVKRYQLEPIEDSNENIPLYLELVGAIDKREPILGIARNVIEPLTSFKQAESILQVLAEHEINNIKVKYSGWLEGGLDHHYPMKASVEKTLGGDKDLKGLINFTDNQGYELYPSVGFLNVYRNSLFNSFNPRQDASRLLNRLIARIYRYQLDIFDTNRRYYSYVLSPSRLDQVVDRFLTSYQDFNLANISLFDMAGEVNSDFIDDAIRMVDREQSINIVKSQFEKMENMKIMVDYGNGYAIPYVDSIINLPNYGSSYHIVDEEIPFYHMVIHGFINFAGSPINLSSNSKRDFLRMIETGGYPYFIGSYQDSSAVKNTKFDYLYALHYGDWLELAASIYHKANKALQDVQNLRIIGHKQLMDNVYQTTYENGKAIIVNYNREAVNISNYVINGEDFIVMEGTVYEN